MLIAGETYYDIVQSISFIINSGTEYFHQNSDLNKLLVTCPTPNLKIWTQLPEVGSFTFVCYAILHFL